VGGESWLKTSYGGKRLIENVRIPSYRGRGSKIALKRHMIYELPLTFLAAIISGLEANPMENVFNFWLFFSFSFCAAIAAINEESRPPASMIECCQRSHDKQHFQKR